MATDLETNEPPRLQGFQAMERAGLEPATPSLQSWCSPN
jgi:hypothetical protein